MEPTLTAFGDYVVTPNTSVREAMLRIDAGRLKTVLVLDGDGRLLGVVSDADIRRALLKGIGLDDEVEQVMNRNPLVASASMNPDEIERFVRRAKREAIPVVDAQGRLVALRSLLDTVGIVDRPNMVVIMAGGRGTRLMPYTDDTPKPMLKVGPKPLLETIVEGFIRQGFQRFRISVNYLSNVIEDHFGDGSKWDVEIDYLRETTPMGTAGALAALHNTTEHALIVINGDVLAHVNYDSLLGFHEASNSVATMCVQKRDVPIAYGVVECDGYRFLGIKEKPVHQVTVNAGIYVLDPRVLHLIEPGASMDMPTLFSLAHRAGEMVSTFPLSSYWLDIGRLDDWRKAHEDYDAEFGEA